METPKEYYYTYYSYEEWGRGYFGSRGCKCLPEEDVKYFGSSKDKTFKPKYKIILKDNYATREEAIADEIILHDYYDVVNNPHFANKAKQTSTKFCVSREDAIKNGKKGGNKSKENHLGFFSENNAEKTKKQRVINAEKGRNTCREKNLGIYSLTEEERVINGRIGGKISGNKTYELKIGIHSLTKEERIDIGKKSGNKTKELKIGIHALTPEQRSENGKRVSKQNEKNKKGIFQLTSEQLSETGRKNYENKVGIHGRTKEEMKLHGSIGAKNMHSQKWKCTVTGHITNPASLTRYQRNRGIDTSNRIRIE
jgi:hypothetical protein